MIHRTDRFARLALSTRKTPKCSRPAAGKTFKFPPVTAKYLKVKLRSNYADVVWIDLYEFRLLGQLKEAGAGSRSYAAAGQ